MKPLRRALVACSLLLALLWSLGPGLAAAQAATAALAIDANHRATVAAGVFAPFDTIFFWFNAPGGGAAAFISDATGPVSAKADGSLDVTIAGIDWDRVPPAATSIVAFGRDSGVSAVALLTPPANLDLTLRIDANHRATTAPIYSRGERIVFWYNLPDGTAAPFVPAEAGFVLAQADGVLDITFTDSQWAAIPPNASSLVAHGLYSHVSAVYVFPR